MCSKKPIYTLGAAERIADDFNHRDRARGVYDPLWKVDAYYCNRCDCYHVGHAPGSRPYRQSAPPIEEGKMPRADYTFATRPAKRQAGGLTTKDVPLEMQEDDDTFTGYFSVNGNIDRAGECVAVGAWSNLPEFESAGWLAYNHDQTSPPIGFPVRATQDSRGLKVTARWHQTEQAQAIRQVCNERLASGRAVFGSVGYRTLASQPAIINGKNCKLLTKLWLAECSIVNLPANELARVIESKAAGPDLTAMRRGIVQALRSGRRDEVLALKCDLEFKAGRTHSAATREKLSAIHKMVAEMLAADDDDDQQDWREDVAPGREGGGGRTAPAKSRHEMLIKLAADRARIDQLCAETSVISAKCAAMAWESQHGKLLDMDRWDRERAFADPLCPAFDRRVALWRQEQERLSGRAK